MTGKQLQRWRLARDLSIVDAAALLGVSRRTIYYLEEGTTSNGRTRRSVPKYIELAVAELSRESA